MEYCSPMTMQKLLTAFTVFLVAITIKAQTEGDQLFATDQVVTIELTFTQEGFWDSLVANYETASYMLADLDITDQTGTYSFPQIGVRLKGNSSYGHPGNKKSFKIDFNEYVSGQNYDGLKKLNFSNNFKDPTFLREKIYSDLCLSNDLPAPRTSYADVYMNGTHWGFYTVIEQIDDQFLDWNMEDDGGNMFKAGDAFDGPGGEADLVYYGADQSSYTERYEIENNEDLNDWTDLIAFIDFINNTTDAEFETGIDDRLETDQYLRSMAMDNLFSNLDAYINSARNYYIYHHEGTGRWNWIKWDCNEAFGSYQGGPMGGGLSMTELDLHYVNNSRPLLERIMEIDGMQARFDDALCYWINGNFSSAKIQEEIDRYYELIKPYVYADENKMYTDIQFENNIYEDITTGGGPGGGTIFGLMSFMEARLDFVEGALDCTAVVAIDESSAHDAFFCRPNPAGQVVWVQTIEPERITVFDLKGQQVLQAASGWVDISALPEGLYILRSDSGNTTRLSVVR